MKLVSHLTCSGLMLEQILVTHIFITTSQFLPQLCLYSPDSDSYVSTTSTSSIGSSCSDDDVMSSASSCDKSDGNDVTVYRQSANFMLKLSELIYNHALQVSVKRSIHGIPGVRNAARRIAVGFAVVALGMLPSCLLVDVVPHEWF